ncbi:beta-galactosidase [Cohnella suwonensis]|uniref:Beta-galactosidase n=1 Tax=Cohnella suwonensis TaxID=696072 RepID=A0ABW0LWU8_9BACL
MVMPIELTERAVRLNGKSGILTSASVFYFRIPQELWKDRLDRLKKAGYNCVDVYFPWNYHELSEGRWSFDEERDAEAFLRLVHEAGLWTVARPGPYICSEWDGGALPAYLLAKDGLTIRDNDPAFLRHVSLWFGQIMPILRRQQIGEGGSVICVQLENELDFYGCKDPRGYIGALRDMALEHRIEVPLIACAGQGGLYAASGLADGVIPTCNFYPNDTDPEFEEKVLQYRELLGESKQPLMVTETNRSHFLLRRLLSAGAKLLGPYLQVSGTDFGFTNGTNNWGEPLAFLTSDYDFGGMISPEGRIRPEVYEGRLLNRLIQAYGSSLAEALPALEASRFRLADGSRNGLIGPVALSLSGGGLLVFLHNTSDESVSMSLIGAGLEEGVPMKLAARSTIAVPHSLPLSDWGYAGQLLHSSAELFWLKSQGDETIAAFHADTEGEMAFRFDEALEWEANGGVAEKDGGRVRFRFGAGGTVSAFKGVASDGRRLVLIVMDRNTALALEDFDPDGRIHCEPLPVYDDKTVPVSIGWSAASIDPVAPVGPADARTIEHADYLEKFGVYRGYAWYQAKDTMPAALRREGILVRQASDVVSVYAGNAYAGTVVPGGSSSFLPHAGEQAGAFTARTEIWGHSNFDDIRKPALRLDSMKGIRGLVAVTKVKDLSGNWRRRLVEGDRAGLADEALDDRSWPITGFGGWLQMERPMVECFRKSFVASSYADSWTLHFNGLQGLAEVYANGVAIASVTPFDPYADISSAVKPGESVQLSVFLNRTLEAYAGSVVLYEGNAAQDWRLTECGEEDLASDAASKSAEATDCELPVSMNAGESRWLFGKIPIPLSEAGWRVLVTGSGVKLSVLFQGRLVSRIWLPGGDARPTMSGGSPDSFWLPGPWFSEKAGELAVYLEAVDPSGPCVIDPFSFIKA